METPWKPEQVLSIESAHIMISDQFPELGLRKIEYFGEGWDNTAFLVNDYYVFRFPRRQLAVALLGNEMRVLPYLKDKLSLAIPFPEFLGHPTETFPWPFVGYAKLSGITACSADLSATERTNNATILANFLAHLHAFPVDEMRKLGITIDSFARVDLSKRIPMTLKNLRSIEEHKILPTQGLQEYLLQVSPIASNTKLCLTHGDFYARHILVDDQKKICGVIDWGDSELGHPAVDISIAHAFLPPEAHALFRDTYGDIDADTWELARVRAIYSLSCIILYGYDVKDQHLFNEGLTGLGYISQELL